MIASGKPTSLLIRTTRNWITSELPTPRRYRTAASNAEGGLLLGLVESAKSSMQHRHQDRRFVGTAGVFANLVASHQKQRAAVLKEIARKEHCL
jgi:hypothetical protein